ncbi:MAG: DNA alkylation repair protein [Candidatus Omnitrophica bacterium]|nr:DNA alkylation repair protein [Candidatus Omnitrophota bacterium]
MKLEAIRQALKSYASLQKAKILQRFFKTGHGDYGEGDVFLGVMVPNIRTVARQYQVLPLSAVKCLLRSDFHEERLLALLILILKFRKGNQKEKNSIYTLYLDNTKYINNWDLVDLSAKHIVGAFLFDKDRKILYRLARSEDLWKKRIAMLSTFHYIERSDFKDALKIALILLNDKHDLIQKAVGWMLREIGKRDMWTEEKFLKTHYHNMPRTSLRYAIERFPQKKRQMYLKKGKPRKL